ncbi:hypothetical protein HID58_071347 [Brassica napus]|uniref:Receptor-like protein 12 n=1 Tax=Brassica napus TaxID=3708 RepID=A0ABQ7Z1G1_BRANA|nr:hypothetical protein HID58_071347 [Brassica napus]
MTGLVTWRIRNIYGRWRKIWKEDFRRIFTRGVFIFLMAKPCFPVSTISSFLCCLFVSSFFVNSLVSLPFPHPDQIEILLAFKNEFPILKCDIRKWSESRQKTKSWTSKVNKSFDGVWFDSETGLVTELDLSGACLSGSLSANSSLFRLHHLRYLDLSNNYFDSFSFLPELAKLTNLEILDLSHMGLAGEIPTSVSSLNRLRDLDLSGNELIGSFSPLINLSRLSYLSLSNNHFSGNVPCSLLTIPSLSILYLSQNHLIGTLETMNCYSTSMLESLYLSNNRLSSGSLEPLSKFFYLKDLDLSFQNTTDPVNFVSLGFKSLESLDLSGNAISRLNIRSPNLKELALNECSINEFPTFIKNLPKLKTLRIANNSLKGEVPKWLWSMPSLIQLSLSHNSLDSFEGSPKVVLNSSLYWLDLIYLNLRNNNLTGNLPNIFDKSSYLITLDVSHNQITGKLPRSLTNCTNLEFVNVGSNRIADSFPFWLKDLPNLQVIVLQSNMFHGPIYSPQHPLSFPQLRIMDISGNKFTGSLPHDYFINWSKLLISIPQEKREYVGYDSMYDYYPSMYLRSKGINMELEKILPKSSFEGNINLCGLPLEQSCFSDKVPSTPEAQGPWPQKQEQVLNWKAAAMGYGPGVLFGLAIGQYLIDALFGTRRSDTQLHGGEKGSITGRD